MITKILSDANNAFFAPNSMQLDALKYHPDAISVLVEWMYEEWKPYDTSLTREALVTSFSSRLNDEKLPITLIVLKADDPIGCISVKHNYDAEFFDFPEGSLWMGSLHVALPERRKGIGEALLNVANRVAQAAGHKQLYFYTSNPANLPWYQKLGATVLKERPFRSHQITILQFNLGK